MQSDVIALDREQLWAFLLVLARVSGIVVVTPVPGWRRGPEAARIVLALALTLCLLPLWPRQAADPGLGKLVGMTVAELVLGLLTGACLSMLVEAFAVAAQMVGVQAGFSYASTIDPSTEADSGVLQVILQLAAMMLLVCFEFDRHLLRAIAGSLTKMPPGQWHVTAASTELLISAGKMMWTTAARLALPVIALLIMTDVVLALAGRINPQLQLLSVAFPAKMIATLALLAMLMGSAALLLRRQLEEGLRTWMW